MKGHKTIMIAKRNIKSGEEVSDFYGCHYFQSPKNERHQVLGFICKCKACNENWPLMKGLPQLTKAQKKHKGKWVTARDNLDLAVDNMKVLEAFDLCRELSNTHGVKPPHECLIMPELYLHYSSVFLYGNKSLAFKVFSDQIIENEVKSNRKIQTKNKPKC